MLTNEKSIKNFLQITSIVLILVFSSKIPIIITKARVTVREFISSGFSYERLSRRDPIFDTIEQAKKIIPKDAIVDVSPQEWEMDRVKARYVLYPLNMQKIQQEWDYFIDLQNVYNGQINGLKNEKLPNGISVFAKPGHSFVSQNIQMLTPSTAYVLLVFLLISSLHIFMGTRILSILRINLNDGLLWYFSTSYGLGFCVLTLVVWILLLCGLQLTAMNTIIAWSIVGIFILAFEIKTRRKYLKFITGSPEILKQIYSSFKPSLHTIVFIIVITAVLLITVLNPVTSWDAMSHWLMKSKVIFHEKALNFEFTHHNQYPILWSLGIAINYSLLGGCYDFIAKWQIGIFFLAFILQLRSALLFLGTDKKTVYILLILFIACFYQESITWAYAETPFLYFYAALLSAIIAWTNNTSTTPYLILGMIFAISLTLIKFEGGIACMIVAVSVSISYYKHVFKRKNWIWIVGLFLVIFIELAWIEWNRSNGYLPALSHFSSGPTVEKVKVIISVSIKLASKWQIGSGLFMGILFAALIVLQGKVKEDTLAIFCITMGMVAFSGLALLGWRKDLIVQVGPQAIPRLFLHATPAITLYCASLINQTKKRIKCNSTYG